MSRHNVGSEKDLSMVQTKKENLQSFATNSTQQEFAPVATDESVRKIIPIFNHDKKYYTPAFMSSDQHLHSAFNEPMYLERHYNKFKDLTQEKQEMFVPKPDKRNSFCCICFTPFEDYLTHLNIHDHQQKISRSIFSYDIRHLCILVNGSDYPSNNNTYKKENLRKVSCLNNPPKTKPIFKEKSTLKQSNTIVKNNKHKKSTVLLPQTMPQL